MDQTGAIIGPLIVAAIVAKTQLFAPAFLVLGIPAVLALASLLLAHHFRPDKGQPPKTKASGSLTRVFWIYVIGAGLLACGFVDFTLLAYHFQNTGLFSPAVIPLLYALSNGVIGLTALVCGYLFDRFGIVVLIFGVMVTMLTLPLGFLGGSTGAVIAVLCWGAGMGVQDATLRAGIARVVSMNKRGHAFGAFNGVFGVLWFVGSTTMGVLYSFHMLRGIVIFGLLFQISAAFAFAWLRRPLATAAASHQ
jgi:MFS family permease